MVKKRGRALTTADGVRRLQAELWDLCYRRVPEIGEQLHEMRGIAGEMAQGGEIQSLVDEMRRLEGRVAELESVLADAEVVGDEGSGRVQLGSWAVSRHEDGAEEHHRLVGPAEADPFRGRLSSASPLGRSLLGRTAGEAVEWRSPGDGAHTAVALQVD